jgi:hypothetical protein
MAFGRRKGNSQLDEFGPLDTLVAAAQTLVGAQREIATSILLDEGFIDAALEDGRRLSQREVETLNQVFRIGFANALAIAKNRASSGGDEIQAARFLLAGCVQRDQHDVNLNDFRDAFALALVAIKGGSRMLELRREEQAMAAIAMGTMIVRFLADSNPGDVVIYVATWGPGGENRCTFFVTPELKISWTPETNEPALFAQDNVVAALSELERALGKEVSFQAELDANTAFVSSLIESGAVTIDGPMEPFFKWEPPLPARPTTGGQ